MQAEAGVVLGELKMVMDGARVGAWMTGSLQEEGVLKWPWKVDLDFSSLRRPRFGGARKLVHSGQNQRSVGCS